VSVCAAQSVLEASEERAQRLRQRSEDTSVQGMSLQQVNETSTTAMQTMAEAVDLLQQPRALDRVPAHLPGNPADRAPRMTPTATSDVSAATHAVTAGGALFRGAPATEIQDDAGPAAAGDSIALSSASEGSETHAMDPDSPRLQSKHAARAARVGGAQNAGGRNVGESVETLQSVELSSDDSCGEGEQVSENGAEEVEDDDTEQSSESSDAES
jgi:hypothetical protein